jgi:hypothetical protein
VCVCVYDCYNIQGQLLNNSTLQEYSAYSALAWWDDGGTVVGRWCLELCMIWLLGLRPGVPLDIVSNVRFVLAPAVVRLFACLLFF